MKLALTVTMQRRIERNEMMCNGEGRMEVFLSDSCCRYCTYIRYPLEFSPHPSAPLHYQKWNYVKSDICTISIICIKLSFDNCNISVLLDVTPCNSRHFEDEHPGPFRILVPVTELHGFRVQTLVIFTFTIL
jgi:hypothetical protein